MFCKPAFACVALATLVGGPRLCEASNEFSRRVAEHASRTKCKTPAEPGSTNKQDDAPAFTAALELCVAKSDTDGRWTLANDVCDYAAITRPDARPTVATIFFSAAPVVALHAPIFNATAPPVSL